ncbi:5-oxoprolinase subunit B family protein [Calidifontibacter indicus]|uniref:5-oxoprolinase subunit B family protein n=1 Tax=Calidifontibacter indicus TaxID=419650 RepID=UPI003D765B37
MRLLPCGDRAMLVELPDADTRRRLDATLRRTSIDGVLEHVPAATTVLVRAEPGDLVRVARELRQLRLLDADSGRSVDDLTIPVIYDGADLAEVAALLDITVAEVIARHTGQTWTVEFAGFAPGFGYLIGSDDNLQVPRRQTPRTRIPAGSVGLADQFSGVYPKASPGGWQLIGRTELAMWDVDRDDPALLIPGRRIRFEAVSA